MGETSGFPQPVVSATGPRRWIAAVVGGVLLGDALWAMLQLLIRDWAAPALANVLGQGPTQNPAAFEPLPLVIAFVEACVAAIVLVLLMSWAQRPTRVVVRTVAAPGAAQVATAPVVAAAAPRAAGTPVAAPAPLPRPATALPVAPAAQPTVAAPVPVASTPIPSQQAVPVAAPVAAPPVTPAPAAAKPAGAPAPKKPKTIYYNSVGEPIEE